MTQRIAVAVLGFWHVHGSDYARSIVNHPDTDLVAIWDDDEERGRAAAAEFGTTYIGDLDALLAREDIDAVTVTTSTAAHRDVMVKAAQAGKHIFTEKLLAPTVAEAEEILAVAAGTGAKVVVSLPRLTSGATLALLDLVGQGVLGTLTYCRVRRAHSGSTLGWLPERFYNPDEAVGGTLTDVGSHPVYVTQLFLGANPSTVAATYAHVTGQALEDNAVVTVGYDNGAVGVAEASNVGAHSIDTVELYGTGGSAIYGFGGPRVLTQHGGTDGAWVEVPIPPDDLPFNQWVEHIHNNTTADANLAAAVELTRLVVAANAAAVVATAPAALSAR